MALQVEKVGEVNWAGLAFRLYLEEPLSSEARERIRALIHAWYIVGAYGGFGGMLHFLSEIGEGDEAGRPVIEWWVDMGSARPEALNTLIRCLETFEEVEQIAFGRLVLGLPPTA